MHSTQNNHIIIIPVQPPLSPFHLPSPLPPAPLPPPSQLKAEVSPVHEATNPPLVQPPESTMSYSDIIFTNESSDPVPSYAAQTICDRI